MKVIKLSKIRIGVSNISESVTLESMKKRPAIQKLEPAAPLVSPDTSKNPALGHLLLKDLVEIFKAEKVPYLRTRDLIAGLSTDLAKPWASYFRGFAITPRQLSSLLAPYGVTSCSLYYKLGNAKGFRKQAVISAYRSLKLKQKKSVQPLA